MIIVLFTFDKPVELFVVFLCYHGGCVVIVGLSTGASSFFLDVFEALPVLRLVGDFSFSPCSVFPSG